MKRLRNLMLGILLVVIVSVALFGCTPQYQYQAKFDLGIPQVQRDQESKKAIDTATGKPYYKPNQAPIMDLGATGEVRAGQRSFVAGGAITNPERQTAYWEKRTITEKNYGDKRDCPQKDQIRKVETEDKKRTEELQWVKTHPEESIPLNVYGNADDGPVTKGVLKAEEAAGNVGSALAFGVSLPKNKADNNTTTTTVSGVSSAKTGPISNQQGQDQGLSSLIVNKPVNVSTNTDTVTTGINIANDLKTSSAAASAANVTKK